MKYTFDALWAEKYRPQIVDDVIVDEALKNSFKKYVEEGGFPNLILHSRQSGTGKTTLAKALAQELGMEVLFINGSINGTIDVVRNDFTNFVKTYSMNMNRKVIIIDEGDKLSTAMQDGLRTFFEENSAHVRFIITCNHLERIGTALQSRCVIHHFQNSELETKKRAVVRTLEILKLEGRKFNPQDVMKFVYQTYPDMRSILNDLQNDSENIGLHQNMFDFELLFRKVSEGSYDDYEAWVGRNITNKTSAESFYTAFSKYYLNYTKDSVKRAVMIVKVHDSLHKLHFVNDPQINVKAFLASVQIEGLLN